MRLQDAEKKDVQHNGNRAAGRVNRFAYPLILAGSPRRIRTQFRHIGATTCSINRHSTRSPWKGLATAGDVNRPVMHKLSEGAKGPIPRGTGKPLCEVLLYSSLYPVKGIIGTMRGCGDGRRVEV